MVIPATKVVYLIVPNHVPKERICRVAAALGARMICLLILCKAEAPAVAGAVEL